MQPDDRDVDLVAAPPGRGSPSVAVVLAVAALLAFGCVHDVALLRAVDFAGRRHRSPQRRQLTNEGAGVIAPVAAG